MARSHLPPGFRFHPTDEELLVHYLKRKAAGKFVDEWVIGEADIYKYEPADLPGLAALRSRDSEWFFFNFQDKRHLHGSRTNRTTKFGYWKATGKDRKVIVGSCVGLKKTLIYYAGRAPHGERTDWVMHEYRLDEDIKRKMNGDTTCVLCRVRRKSGLGPRNGEQYGAPVLEEEEEEVVNNSEVSLLPSPFVKERQVQEVLPITTAIEGVRTGMETRREDLDSFLQNFISFEESGQDQAQKADLMVDELLDLLKDQGDLALTTDAAPADILGVDSNNMDDFCNLVHPADGESVMLEDMLHLVTGHLKVPPAHQPRMQAPSNNLHMDTLQSVGFLELADLEEPCHEQSTLESAAFESLLLELDAGMNSPMSAGLVEDELQMQQILQTSGNRESVRGFLQPVGNNGIINELEVPLDSSQGLSVLGSIPTRLLTSAGDAAPSGLVSSLDQEGAFARSHSHRKKAQEQREAEHLSVNNLVENGNSSPPCGEPGVAHEEQLVSHPESRLKVANSIAEPPIDSSNNQFAPSTPSPLSPSPFARVISACLGKFNTLPASADELPLEFKKEESLCFTDESKVSLLPLRHPRALTISVSSLNCRVRLTPLHNGKQISRTPKSELQWSMSSTTVLDQHHNNSCRSFTNGISMFLFWITTVALIMFCMFRGFCRATRVVFT